MIKGWNAENRLVIGRGIMREFADEPERQIIGVVGDVRSAALDSDPGVRASAHIFVGSRAVWFEITDDLPQFQEMPT